MSETATCAESVPKPRRLWAALSHVAEPLDAVAVAINRVPKRHETARFGEQEKQDPVDDRQRLLERFAAAARGARVEVRPHRGGRSGLQHCSEDLGGCFHHSGSERAADRRGVLFRFRHQVLQRVSAVRVGAEHLGVQDPDERREGPLIINRILQVELRIAPGIDAARIDDSDAHAVVQNAPSGLPGSRMHNRGAPERIEPLSPVACHDADGGGPRARRRDDNSFDCCHLLDPIEPKGC